MGETLLKTLTEATELPQDLINKEMTSLIEAAGKNKENLTMDDLRQILSDYALDVLANAKEHFAAEDESSTADVAIMPLVR